MIDSKLALSREEMREIGYRVIDLVVDHVASLGTCSLGRRTGLSETLSKWSEALPEDPAPYNEILDQLQHEVFPNTLLLDHPRFFGYVPGPSNFIGVMGETLATGFNTFAGTWLEASAAAAIELNTIRWLAQLCGFPDATAGLFVSGGTMANLTALTVARRQLLDDQPGTGILYLSDQAHSSLLKVLRVMGFQSTQIRRLRADDEFRLRPDAVLHAIRTDRKAGFKPFCIVATAGTTNTGAVDPLPELREICDSEAMWLHVDGAYGAAAVICEQGRRLLRGLSLADSLTIDPHKWLFQPYQIGCVLVRKGNLLDETFRLQPEYLQDIHRNAADVNFADLGIELTRGFRALKLWLSLKVFGMRAFREAVAHGFRMAEYAEEVILKMPGWEIVSPAQMAILCFRHRDGNDIFQAALVDAMLQDGFTYTSSTSIRGQTVIRLCTINPRTTEHDIDLSLQRIDALAQSLHDSLRTSAERKH